MSKDNELNHSKIEQISENIKKFVLSKEEDRNKMNNLEEKINKMQHYIIAPQKTNNTDEYGPEKNILSDFRNYIKKGIHSDLVLKSLSVSGGEGSALLTNSLQQQIIDVIHNKIPIRNLASVENISSSALDVIIADGEFDSGWVAEQDQRPDTNNPTLKKKTIEVHELYAQPKATQKLLDDAEIQIEKWLIERLSDSFANTENNAFLYGDGDKKPYGLIHVANDNDKVEKIYTDSKIRPELFLEMINKLPEEYLSGATFLMHRSTLAAIQSIKDATERFMWQPALTDPLKCSIFGVPVVCMSQMQKIEENNMPIILADFKAAYKIVDRKAINLMRDPYTEKPYIKFYTVKRSGGDVIRPHAMNVAIVNKEKAEEKDAE